MIILIFFSNFHDCHLFLFLFYLFIYDSHTQREREAETQAEREAGSMHREPDVGFDPRSPGSRPGPKAGVKPLRHPGIPCTGDFIGKLGKKEEIKSICLGKEVKPSLFTHDIIYFFLIIENPKE